MTLTVPSRFLPAALVVTAAMLVTLPGLGNGFAYDDVPLLVRDVRLHAWSTLPERVGEPWWPTGLFRPVSLAVLGLQWITGDGAPWVFRLVATALYALVTFGVLLLARAGGASPLAATAAGLLFAVHPVHSEVTANVVGQAELLSAVFGVSAVVWYVRIRRRGGPLHPGRVAGITGLALLAANAKESGYVIPGLLVAAEMFLIPDPRPWRDRWRCLRPAVLALAAVLLASLLVRSRVLGALGGETPHPALAALGPAERLVAMLAMVPEWARLLLWPAKLQAEYSPPGVIPATMPGSAHAAGIFLIGLTTWGIVTNRRRRPIVAFGLAWASIALVPVANVLAPTGVLLAERTLFLPSVGITLALGSVAQQAWEATRKTVLLQRASGLAFLLLVVAAGTRTAARQPVWRDTMTLLGQTVQDAPASYRAQYNLGKELEARGRAREAEAAFRRAIALWDREPRPFEELGQLLRAQGRCTEAIPVLARAVAIDSTSDIARSRLVQCLIMEHRWEAAEREIARGLGQGVNAYTLVLERVRSLRR